MTAPSDRGLGGNGTWKAPSRLHVKEPWRWAAHFPAASSVTGEHLKPLPLHARWNQAVDEKWKSCLLLQPDSREHADEWIWRLRHLVPHTREG